MMHRRRFEKGKFLVGQPYSATLSARAEARRLAEQGPIRHRRPRRDPHRCRRISRCSRTRLPPLVRPAHRSSATSIFGWRTPAGNWNGYVQG